MEVPRRERLPAPRVLLGVALVSAIVSALCVVLLDRPVARWLAGYEPAGFWDRGIEILEVGLGLPVFPILSSLVLAAGMLVAMAVPRWRAAAPAWILVAGTHILARFATARLKDATGRLRPRQWLEAGGDTFGRDGGISFPSGHVVLFASVLIPLAIVAPRTRPLLAIVGFVMVARVAVNAHFVADVTGSITLVALVAWTLGRAVRPIRT